MRKPANKIICPHCGEENPPSPILTTCRKCLRPLDAAKPPEPTIDLPPPPDFPKTAISTPSEVGTELPAAVPPAEPDLPSPSDVPQLLAPAPRHVPVTLRLQVLFGSAMGQFGWFFLGFGMIFVWVFGTQADLLSLRFLGGRLATATGVVLQSDSTSVRYNGRLVFAHHYSFATPGGEQHRGVSYGVRRLEPGSRVTVEYREADPSVSRIQGMGHGILPWWVLLFVSIFPAVGIGFIIPALRQGTKACRLLGHGRLAAGILRAMEPTGSRINNQPVYKMVFGFQADDGRAYEATANTHEPERLRDQQQELLLYDPFDPSYAVMLDSLPGAPEIDQTGRFRARRPAAALRALLLPMVTIVGHGVYAAFRYLL
jgi:hypothetical protein